MPSQPRVLGGAYSTFDPVHNPSFLIPDESIMRCPLASYLAAELMPCPPRISFIQSIMKLVPSMNKYTLAMDQHHLEVHTKMTEMHLITITQWFIVFESALMRSRKVQDYLAKQEGCDLGRKSLFKARIVKLDALYARGLRITSQALPEDAEKLFPVTETLRGENENRSHSLPETLMEEAGNDHYRVARLEERNCEKPLIPAYLRIPNRPRNYILALQAMSQWPAPDPGTIFNEFRDCWPRSFLDYYPRYKPTSLPYFVYRRLGNIADMTPLQAWATERLFVALGHIEIHCPNVSELELSQFMYKTQMPIVREIWRYICEDEIGTIEVLRYGVRLMRQIRAHSALKDFLENKDRGHMPRAQPNPMTPFEMSIIESHRGANYVIETPGAGSREKTQLGEITIIGKTSDRNELGDFLAYKSRPGFHQSDRFQRSTLKFGLPTTEYGHYLYENDLYRDYVGQDIAKLGIQPLLRADGTYRPSGRDLAFTMECNQPSNYEGRDPPIVQAIIQCYIFINRVEFPSRTITMRLDIPPQDRDIRTLVIHLQDTILDRDKPMTAQDPIGPPVPKQTDDSDLPPPTTDDQSLNAPEHKTKHRVNGNGPVVARDRGPQSQSGYDPRFTPSTRRYGSKTTTPATLSEQTKAQVASGGAAGTDVPPAISTSPETVVERGGSVTFERTGLPDTESSTVYNPGAYRGQQYPRNRPPYGSAGYYDAAHPRHGSGYVEDLPVQRQETLSEKTPQAKSGQAAMGASGESDTTQTFSTQPYEHPALHSFQREEEARLAQLTKQIMTEQGFEEDGKGGWQKATPVPQTFEVDARRLATGVAPTTVTSTCPPVCISQQIPTGPTVTTTVVTAGPGSHSFAPIRPSGTEHYAGPELPTVQQPGMGTLPMLQKPIPTLPPASGNTPTPPIDFSSTVSQVLPGGQPSLDINDLISKFSEEGQATIQQILQLQTMATRSEVPSPTIPSTIDSETRPDDITILQQNEQAQLTALQEIGRQQQLAEQKSTALTQQYHEQQLAWKHQQEQLAQRQQYAEREEALRRNREELATLQLRDRQKQEAKAAVLERKQEEYQKQQAQIAAKQQAQTAADQQARAIQKQQDHTAALQREKEAQDAAAEQLRNQQESAADALRKQQQEAHQLNIRAQQLHHREVKKQQRQTQRDRDRALKAQIVIAQRLELDFSIRTAAEAENHQNLTKSEKEPGWNEADEVMRSWAEQRYEELCVPLDSPPTAQLPLFDDVDLDPEPNHPDSLGLINIIRLTINEIERDTHIRLVQQRSHLLDPAYYEEKKKKKNNPGSGSSQKSGMSHDPNLK